VSLKGSPSRVTQLIFFKVVSEIMLLTGHVDTLVFSFPFENEKCNGREEFDFSPCNYVVENVVEWQLALGFEMLGSEMCNEDEYSNVINIPRITV
jgi:hypothetical protein